MRIGYACLTRDVFPVNYKNIRKKNFNQKNFYEIIRHNLLILEKTIDYNIAKGINLFRISSDLIPFGSSLANQYPWTIDFAEDFKKIGAKIKKNNIRVSLHPGQYTVLNSNREQVVKNAIADLQYHAKILDLLAVDNTNKIVIHIGGVYEDKTTAMARFVTNYFTLDESIKKRLIIENDEKNFNISDVLEISEEIKIPVVFDNLHHLLNPTSISILEILQKCRQTWHPEDGVMKIHYSEQDDAKKAGAHSVTIDCQKLLQFLEKIPFEVDVMLEVKDKNISVEKCQKYLKERLNV